MSLLLSEEILPAICRELDKSRNSVQVVTAFCKLPAIEKLSKHISSTVSEKRILIRFLLSDLIGGSTDFMVLDYCMRNGWNCFIRFDLHAKTYILSTMMERLNFDVVIIASYLMSVMLTWFPSSNGQSEHMDMPRVAVEKSRFYYIGWSQEPRTARWLTTSTGTNWITADRI